MARVLVVDDEKSVRKTLKIYLERDGHQVRTADSAPLAMAELGSREFDVVVADIIMPKMNGLELLARVHDTNPEIEVVLITAQPDLSTAVTALRQGAFDYLSKPLGGERVCQVVNLAAKANALKVENRRLAEENRRHAQQLEEVVFQRTSALRESEARFRCVFDDGPLGMAITESDLRLANVNETFCVIMDRSRDELIGAILPEMFLTDSGDVSLAECECHALERYEVARFERRFRRRNGEPAWARVTGTALRHELSVSTHCLFMLEDITQQRMAADRLQSYQQELRDLAIRLAYAEDRERRRIAVDLHDVAAQNLALVMLRLREIQRRVATTACESVIVDTHSLVEETANDLRLLSRNLSPPMLYELGLEAALETLAKRFEEERAMSCRFLDDGLPKPLAEHVMTTAYRCAAELLANTAKYAQASSVQVSIGRNGEYAEVVVSDDGVGFDLPKTSLSPSTSPGFGLFSIRERMRALGGAFALESKPGCGTKAVLRLPLSRTAQPKAEATP